MVSCLLCCVGSSSLHYYNGRYLCIFKLQFPNIKTNQMIHTVIDTKYILYFLNVLYWEISNSDYNLSSQTYHSRKLRPRLRFHLQEFHCNQFVASLLESLDDISDESSLDTIWLDHDEGSVILGCFLFGHDFRTLTSRCRDVFTRKKENQRGKKSKWKPLFVNHVCFQASKTMRHTWLSSMDSYNRNPPLPPHRGSGPMGWVQKMLRTEKHTLKTFSIWKINWCILAWHCLNLPQVETVVVLQTIQ